jgi:hypothetical protein
MARARSTWCAVAGLAALILGRPASASAGDPHRAFVTSVSGTGDLASWSDAGGHTGLTAADAICQARAAAGQVANPAAFVAWLSDSHDDAWCRVHGFTGKRAANCGQGTLPSGAGPWLRLDGFPFAATIDEVAAANVVYTPLRVTELGTIFDTSVYTATRADGTFDPASQTCADWTSASSGVFAVRVGSSFATGTGWTNSGPGPCNQLLNLYCLEKGAGAPLGPAGFTGRAAFTSAAVGTGELASWANAGGVSGVAAADAVCRSGAALAGLPHVASFKAWVSVPGADAVSRFVADGPWVRPDGMVIAGDRAALASGLLIAPLNQTPFGTYLGNEGVWTGTSSDGLSKNPECLSWTSASAGQKGTSGVVQYADASWTEFYAASCNFGFQHLACLSDTAIVQSPGVPLAAGGAVTLTGSGITPGAVLKVYVATSSGTVDVIPDGLAPTSTTPTSWSGNLPWPWPAGGNVAHLLGNGFVSLQLVQTDLGYNATDAVGNVLAGNAVLGVPSVTTIGGVALSATSYDLSVGTANVQGLVTPGASLVIGGSGFASAVVNLFTASGNVGPLTPSSQSATSLIVPIPANAPVGPGSFQVVNTTNFLASNAVSVPIGEAISVSNVSVNGNTVNVTGTGFNSLTVINLFASSGGGVVNAGGLGAGGAPNVPLSVADSHHFSFTRPAGLDAGPANVQAINPPFIAYTTSSSGGGFTLP